MSVQIQRISAFDGLTFRNFMLTMQLNGYEIKFGKDRESMAINCEFITGFRIPKGSKSTINQS